MTEFELKFQLPPEQRRAVKAFVAGRATQRSRRVHLQAAYFDTPDRLLARSQMALRLRHEGDGWVQTLKGGGGDGLARQEHNLPLGQTRRADPMPQVDPSRHAGVAIGDRLIGMLADRPGAGLICRYRSDVRRTIRELATRYGKVELAFDEGFLESDGRRLPLCELEIELLDGHPLAVLDVARRWALRFGLWLDVRSKAQRGDMLADGVDYAPPRKAAEVRLDGADSATVSLQAALAECRAHVFANASQIASGLCESEHVHQMRVGLRRLRTVLQLFDDDPVARSIARPLAEPSALMFRALGPSRDRAVLAGPIGDSIRAAWREAGQTDRLSGWPGVSAVPTPTPTALVQSRPCQELMIDLIEAGLPAFSPAAVSNAADWPSDVPAADKPASTTRPAKLLARRLARWHRAVLRDAAAFESLDDSGRHRLRKRLKRLVYGAGFASRLLERKPLRRLLATLKPVQTCLGDLNDVVCASASISADSPIDWFARGWLLARRQALLVEAGRLVKGLRRSDRSVWKRRSKAGRR